MTWLEDVGLMGPKRKPIQQLPQLPTYLQPASSPTLGNWVAKQNIATSPQGVVPPPAPPVARHSTLADTNTSNAGGAASGTNVGTTTVNPEAPNAPAPGGTGLLDSWKRYLSLIGAADSRNPEAAGGWAQQWGDPATGGDKSYYRKNIRGFDFFGLTPQTNESPKGWAGYENASAGLPHFVEQNLKDLSAVWAQYSDPEQQAWRDRLLQGTGLPSDMLAVQQARPQWINDYISQVLDMAK